MTGGGGQAGFTMRGPAFGFCVDHDESLHTVRYKYFSLIAVVFGKMKSVQKGAKKLAACQR